MAAQADIAILKYEAALAELEALITRLERGDVALDDAVACYQRGSALARRCAELLDSTEATVMQLVVGAGGVEEERPLAAFDDEPGPRIVASTPSRPAERPAAPPPPGSPARARTVSPRVRPAGAAGSVESPVAGPPRDSPMAAPVPPAATHPASGAAASAIPTVTSPAAHAAAPAADPGLFPGPERSGSVNEAEFDLDDIPF